KGVTMREAQSLITNANYFGSMMVHLNDADGLIAGLTQHYPDTIRPALQIIKVKENRHIVAGLYMMMLKRDIYFFADTTVNIEPTAEQLAEIALGAAEFAQELNIPPRIAMLSFSNFGSVKHPLTMKVNKACEIVRRKNPELIIDGEMQADTAVLPEKLQTTFPFSRLQEKANILIFPDLQSGNIGYKLVQRLGGADTIGPMLMGLQRPVHILERGCTVDAIVKMTAIAVVEAQAIALKK
ncbi:phosphate acyltransferase, partial [candidate division CSSED10-310 bacterium]